MIKSADKVISWTISLQYILISIQLIIQLFIPGSSPLKIIVSLLFKFIIAALMLSIISIVIQRRLIYIIVIYMLLIFYVLTNILFFTDNINYIIEIQFDLLFVCITSFVYVTAIKEYKYLLNSLWNSAKIVGVLTIFYYLIKYHILNQSNYDMYMSYIIVFSIILNLQCFFNKKNHLLLLLIMINFVILLQIGSRGALICIATYFLISFLLSNVKVLYKIINAAFIVVFYINYHKVFSFLNNIFLHYGIKSRTLRLLSNEKIHLSGRDIIYENTKNAIKQNPLKGVGMAGDRLIHGIYSHNIVLEILVTFGIIFGTLILISVLILIIYAMFLNKNIYLQKLTVAYFSYVIPMLMVSRTFWTQTEFWVLIAISIMSIKYTTIDIEHPKTSLIIQNKKNNTNNVIEP